MYIFQSEQVNN